MWVNNWAQQGTSMTSLQALISAMAAFIGILSPSPIDSPIPPKQPVAFGSLVPLSAEDCRKLALAWLTEMRKADARNLEAFERIWAQQERPVLDRLADTFSLGDPHAAHLLASSRKMAGPVPTSIPDILRDASKPVFFRANLAVAYARNLSHRRIYEEALAVLKLFAPEQVVDPSSYLFHRAVAEHAMLLKEDATRTILRLLDDTLDVPDRHKMVAILMAFEMGNWHDKDLGAVARKMHDIERRLNLARGGPKTQKMQKEVVARLDEIIKRLENQSKGNSNGGGCPNGGNQGQNAKGPSNPMPDSYRAADSGPGNVDPTKRFERLTKDWGKLPEKERAEALQNLARDIPNKYREVVENYFKKLATSESAKP
jgi:hypothetical protein